MEAKNLISEIGICKHLTFPKNLQCVKCSLLQKGVSDEFFIIQPAFKEANEDRVMVPNGECPWRPSDRNKCPKWEIID